MATDWLIWQLADSAFPAGGFAHSGGLEAAWQSGMLKTAGGLADLLRTMLRQAARGSAPFAVATCRDPSGFGEVDLLCDAFLSNHVANRASRSQGQTFLAAASRVFDDPAISEFATSRSVEGARPCLHFGPVFGVIAGRLGISAAEACNLFLFLSLRSWMSASVRLGIVGPLQGQSIQRMLSAEANDLVDLSIGLSIDNVAQTAPILDLAQGTHDRLYSRLFQS